MRKDTTKNFTAMNDYNKNLHIGARKSIMQNAHDLRMDLTEAEKILWEALRNRRLNNCKFRRQHALENYVADFYCHEAKLVIELDGEIHGEQEQKEYDRDRTSVLKQYGLKVMRFKNEEVVNELEVVLDKIKQCLNSPHPGPLL